MSELDPFAKRLVAMVRDMPDGVLLELVRTHLGANHSKVRRQPNRASTSSRAPHGKKRRTKKRGRRRGANRQALEAAVLEVVTASQGVALAAVTEAVGAPKPRVSAVLRSLKGAGAIHAAGDRRFTRYGKSKAIAAAASKKARKG